MESKPKSEGEEVDCNEVAAENLRLLGEAFHGKDQFMDALNYFDAAAVKAPKMALVFISRGRCNLDMEQKGMRPIGSSDKPSKKELVSFSAIISTLQSCH